jgi:RHS repeat-associated protein
VITYAYDAARQLTTVTRPNGLATHYTYDADARIATIIEDAGTSISIQRDAAGRIISQMRTQIASPTLAPGVSSNTFDAANQVNGFTYDDMGRLTLDPVRTYAWDMASRLTGYAGADGAATASYDAMGMRTTLTTGTGAWNYVWNYATDVPTMAVVRTPDSDQRYYIYEPEGTLSYAVDAGTGARHYYHFDGSGSTVMLTDDTASVSDSYAITPFGESVVNTGSTDNPFTWMGRLGVMQEGATGLYYMRGRYYDSATARFLSQDPIFIPAPLDVNPYQYAHNDPLAQSDPMGTQTGAGLINAATDGVSNGFTSLKQYTPEAGSALDLPGAVAFGTAAVGKGLSGYGDELINSATKQLGTNLSALGSTNPGATIVTEGSQFAAYNQATQFANGLKQAGAVVDAAGKFVDVFKEGVKLNDSIIAAQKTEATNSAATDVAEASFLKEIWSLRKAGKISSKEYLTQARAYIAATNESRNAGLSVLVIDEWIAGAKFTQNSLVSLASSGVTKGKFATKKFISALTGMGKGTAVLGTWVGSLWSGTNVNAK